jgi:glycosyltransferase involved in cell wall biosynthesis
MKVSVVIPTYNRAGYIGEAVASVLAQTFQDFEIIIVDDGSTDETANIVHAIQDSRISFLTQEHRGVSAAVDLGWRAARGEYIARLDSDDRWLATLLQELVAVLDADAAADVVYARAQGMDADGKPLPQLIGTAERFPGETLKSLIYGDFVCPGAVLVRRSAIARVGGYDESLIANEDWDIWIRIAQHAYIRYVPRVLAQYRYHPQNLTRTTSDRMERVMQDRVRVLDKFFAGSNIPQDMLEIKPIAYSNLYLDWTIRYLERSEWRKAFPTFRRAYAFAPSHLTFLPRAFALTAYYLFLSKTTWGVRWVENWSKRRRAFSKK